MEDVKHLINSRRGYRSHLKWLIGTAGETIERCSNNTSKMDDATSLADLIEQLERKRTILVDLDKQISAGISDDDLETEVLESEEIQSELSSTIARVKCLMQKLQALTHSPRSSSPSQVSETNISSSRASSETTTLPTPPQSPVHQEGTHHGMTECPTEHMHSDSQGTQGKPQRLTSDILISNTPLTEPHMSQHGINSTVRLPRLGLPTFSGDALEWQPFWDGFNAAVNSNPSISDVQKLNYLRS